MNEGWIENEDNAFTQSDYDLRRSLKQWANKIRTL